jgi:hypothetical protein
MGCSEPASCPADDPPAPRPDPPPQAAPSRPTAPSASGSKDPGGRRQQAGSRSPLTSWASRAGRCWPPWSPASATPRRWRSRPRASCASSSPSCARRCGAASATTMRCWSGWPLTTRGHLEGATAALDGRIDEVIAPFAVARDRLGDHHRGRQRAAEVIIADMRGRLTVFPTAGHPASWAGRCPGNNITGASVARASPPGATAGWPMSAPSAPGPRPEAATPTWPPSCWRLARRIGKQDGHDRRRPLHPGHRLAPAHQRR